ncbi:hypothetical protein BJX61DRAFT_549445 [Aspergillus egyptiacus]|nr:hypothetical protein BJX61DRAFT_549445 [Aspergillus egyptiacus]
MVEESPDPPQPHPVGTDRPRPESSSHASTAAHSSSRCNSDDWDQDVLELHQIETQLDDESTWSLSSGESRITPHRTVSRVSQSNRPPREGFVGRIQRFWRRNVVLTVPQKNNRDHFALERTFLAYIRTSVILAMQGVLIAQLFRLQSPASSGGLGYHEVGVPLSMTCHAAAIVIALLGAHRFWRQQHAVALGTVYAGGWEMNCIGLLVISVSH